MNIVRNAMKSLALLSSIFAIHHADAAVDSTLWAIYSNDVRFSPKLVENAYLEYEYYGQVGPVDLYGYFDAPKYFGGNENMTGVWDKDSSKLFMEHEPKLSFNRLTGKDLSVGPFKDWFIATDWILDAGSSVTSRQNTLHYGLGTAIDTHSKLGVSLNVYAKQQWENYGAANAYTSDDGGRLQVQFFYPLHTFGNGAQMNYFSFSNYDFGSNLAEKTADAGTPGMRTDEAFVSTHVFSYNLKHFRSYAAARYFHNGGQFKDAYVNSSWGPTFTQNSTGWAYYVGLGYQF